MMKKLLALTAAAILAGPNSHATIVFGNLGPNGDATISDTGSDFGPSAASLKILAQGFTTGSDSAFLSIQSVSIGAFFDNVATADRTVSIYSNSGGNPGSVVATSTATTIGGKGLYTFSFSSLVNLSASTSYWVVPQFNVDWFWYVNQAESNPEGLNSSGYTYLATRRSDNDISGTWNNTVQPYSLSITASSGEPIPEPGTWAAAALLIGAAGYVRWRRRSQAA